MHTFKSFIIIFFIILSELTFPQKFVSTFYQFPDTIPGQYIFNVKKEYNNIANTPVPGYKKKDIERYAEAVSYGKQELFTSGYVYLNWEEMETYLNKVIQQIIPDSLKGKFSVHVYPVKDAGYNAFAIHDGSLFVNIGLFADVVNEAGLAIILGHELSHFLDDDAKNGFLKSLKLYTKKNRNNNYFLKLNHAKYDRWVETKADSLGFILSEEAGYDLFNGISNFLQFKEIEAVEKVKKNKGSRLTNVAVTKEEKKDSALSKSLDDLFATHPDLSDRIKFLDDYLKSAERRKDKKDYIIDENAFQKLQETAKRESLSILLSQNDFKECAERSFIYYLLDPSNQDYLYFLLESMRRAMYMDGNLKDKGFLSDEIKGIENNKSILHKLQIIIPDSVKYSKIKDVSLSDTTNIPFETYDEAFRYFSKIAIDNKINESILTIALYYYDTDSLKNKYLKEYCALNNIKYRDYASALINGSIYTHLAKNNGELLLLDDITFLEDHYYGYHNRLILSEKRTSSYVAELKRMLSKCFPQYNLVEMNKLSFENLKAKMEYENAILATTYCLKKGKEKKGDVIYFKGGEEKKEEEKQTDIFILNPDYWNIFKEKNLKSIGYMNITAFDDKTKIVKLLNVINPAFWYTIMARVYAAMYNGSLRYAHEVSYYSYDIFSKQAKIYSDITSYKMSKAYFLNSIYYALKTKPKE